MAKITPYTGRMALNPASRVNHQQYIKVNDPQTELMQAALGFAGEMNNELAKAERQRQEADGALMVAEYRSKLDEINKTRELQNNYGARRINDIVDEDGKVLRPGKYYKDWESEVNALDEEYSKRIPQIVASDVQKKMNFEREQAKGSFLYSAAKFQQQEARRAVTEFITLSANGIVGKPGGIQEKVSGDVDKELEKQIKAGVLTPEEARFLRHDYDNKVKESTLKHYILTQPAVAEEMLKKNTLGFDQEKLDTYRGLLETKKKQYEIQFNEQQQAALDSQVLTVLDLIKKRHFIPIDTLMNIEDKKIRDGLLKNQEYALRGEEAPTNHQLYDYLMTQADNNPVQFKKSNLWQYVGDLNINDLAVLRDVQNRITLSGSGSKEFAVKDNELNMAADLRTMAYNRMGYTSDKKYAEQKYQFNQMYAAEAQQAMMKKGAELTRAEREEIVNNLTKDVLVRRSFLWNTSATAANADSETRVYVPFNQISRTVSSEITAVMNRNFSGFDDLPKSERQRFYEEMAGALELPSVKQNARLKVVYNNIRKSIDANRQNKMKVK